MKHFRRLTSVLLYSFLLFSFTPGYSQNTPVYKGLLWEISGKGMKKPSYLYGTMHVSNKIAFHLTDTFFIALKNCDMVALEINPETLVQDLMKTPGYASSMTWGGENFIEFYKRAFSPNTPDNKAISKILSQEHSFANYLLYRSSFGRRENFEENTYLDLFIFQAGKKLNKQVCGLEDLAFTRELSIRAAMERDAEEDKPEVAFSRMEVYEKLQDAYRKGDLDMLDSLNKLVSSKKYVELMLYYRNEIMANRMDSLMGKVSLFIGIGAAHLPGEKGVIELLRKKGYTVRAVASVQKKSTQMKEKIEQTFCKLNCTDQVPEDSLFRVALPGTMISEVKALSASDKSEIICKEYFFPDMANGTYYSVNRISTFAPLHEISQEALMKKIDSLLYENIPGKILSKKITSFNGIPGYDIVNRTRKGDLQRYHILVSPMEIIVFKLTGVGDYISKEGDKFFGSIKIAGRSAGGWSSFAPSGGGFSISMPGNMSIQNNSELSRGSSPEYLIQSVDESGNYYFLMKTNYNDFAYIEEDTFELNILAKNFYKSIKYSPSAKSFFQLNGHPGLHLHLKKEEKNDLQLKVMICGASYYLIGVKSKDSLVAKKFFNSFNLKEYRYLNTFEVHKDTSLYFSVKTPVKPVAESPYERMYAFSKKDKKKDNSHQGYYKDTKFVSASTSEVIKVELVKFHAYRSYKNAGDFWKKRIDLVSGDGSMISNKTISKDSSQLDLVLTDTNSTRSIKMKMILKAGALYTLSTNIDTIRPPSEFVRTFFETFQPADTVIGSSVFENKGDKFFEAFESKDSTRIAQAISSLDVIRFDDKHAAKIISTFKTFNFSKISEKPEDVKTTFIRELGLIKGKEIIPFLKEKYAQSTDTFNYQMGILKALARHKTPESYRTIVELLQSDIPLASESDIEGLFKVVKDSMRMCVHLYPKLLEFTRYPEYKGNIYELLAILVDSNYIKPASYLTYKDIIIRDARDEVKRKFASGESSSRRYSFYDYDYNYGFSGKNKRPSIDNILYAYAILLMPYYNESSVAYFYDRMKKIKDDELLLDGSILLLKHKKEVADSIWTKFAKDDSRRLDLYASLKEIERLDKFDSSYLTQEYFARALICQHNFDKEKDTIVFMEKRKVKTNKKEGYVYYFKRRSKDARIWKLDYVGIQPADTSQFEVEYTVKQRGIQFNPNELKKIIDESLEELALEGRKRAGRSRRYGDFFLDDLYLEDECLIERR